MTASDDSGGAIIFLHGSGDSGEGLRDWLDSTTSGAFRRRLEAAKIAAVFPSAPETYYTLAKTAMPVWFDRQAMAYEAPEDAAGVARSVAQVDAEVEKLVAGGVPLQRIGVAGLSMGGCVALHVAYGAGRHAGRLGAAACLSSFLAEGSGLDATARARGRCSGPLLMAHGGSDPMVSPKWAHATRERLASAGVPAPAEVVIFPTLGHSMCEEELELLASFLVRHLASPQS